MGRNDYNEEYLAHSKGPWKKHKYIKKVGNRYYYAGSKGYYKALATSDDANYTDSQKRAAKKVNARNANKANLKRASRKQRMKNIGVSARLNVQKAVRTGSAAIDNLMKKAKNSAKRAGRMAKVYGDKAHFARLDAQKAASKAATNVKNKAKRASRMAKVYSDKAHFARLDAQKAVKKGYTKAKTTAERKVALAKGKVRDAQTKRNMNKIRKNVAKAKKKRSSGKR